MWNLVTKRIATLTELETTWSLMDMVNANEALQAVAAAEYEFNKRHS